MVGTRDTPRDLQDAPDYSYPGGVAPLNSNMAKATLQTGNPGKPVDPVMARNLARQCYESSTSWLNSGRRAKWNDSLRAFQGLHPQGSKYLSSEYRYRSRLFRPKTRAMVRKAEAATAAAFFSNEDVVSIKPQDDDNPYQQASAAINEKLLQYRLTNTIPWFLTLTGARQDAEVMGICIAKAYWKYKEQFSHSEERPIQDPTGGTADMTDEDGQPLTESFDIYNRVEDRPWVDLIPPENFRADPGADWRNIVASSPYTIELVPVYIGEARAKVKSGEWLPVSESAMRGASDLDDDVTRRSREQGRVPGKDHDAWKPTEYDICWVRENILRIDGKEWHFFSLSGGGELLTMPRPLEEVYLQGIRPYVAGFVILEAHKTYPSSKVELVRDLQTQTNDIGNLRLDNVKLNVNPRQFVKEGRGIDPADVRSFQPAKVIMVKDPKEDIVWDRPPEVTAEAYQEQDRLNIDFDDLTGDVSNSSVQSNRGVYEAVGNMQLMSGNASQIGEYEQRTFSETFVEPLLKHLIKLEQAYETDPVVLAIAGRDAQLYQRYGINDITDDLLKQELTVKVNVGIGATNPQTRLKNFMTAGEAVKNFFGEAAAIASNPEEVIKEIFGLCGYKDGDRFFLKGIDIHQVMMQMMQGKGQQKGGAQNDPNKLAAAQVSAQSKLKEREIQTQGDLEIAKLDYQKEMMKQQFESQRDKEQTQQDMIMAHHDRMFDHQQKQQDRQHQLFQHLTGGGGQQQQPGMGGGAGGGMGGGQGHIGQLHRRPQPQGQPGMPQQQGGHQQIHYEHKATGPIHYDKKGQRIKRGIT